MSDEPEDDRTADVPEAWLHRFGLALCAIWGFAEAALFFVVPDVAVGAVGLYRPRRALAGAAAAVGGAVVGGVLLYCLGGVVGSDLRAVMDAVPAIPPRMIDVAHEGLGDKGGVAMFIGVSEGIPYKLYAVEWSILGWGLPALVGWTIPARAFRFFLVGLVAAGVGAACRRSIAQRPAIWGAAYSGLWMTFYAAYWFIIVPTRFG